MNKVCDFGYLKITSTSFSLPPPIAVKSPCIIQTPQKHKLCLGIHGVLVPAFSPPHPRPCRYQTPGCIKWCRSMHTVSLQHLQTPSCGLKAVPLFILKSIFKWTYTVQICVVQGSTVFCFVFVCLHPFCLSLPSPKDNLIVFKETRTNCGNQHRFLIFLYKF